MSKERSERPEASAYYRKKAEEMLRNAETATTPEARAKFLDLADHWHRLAQVLENPNW